MSAMQYLPQVKDPKHIRVKSYKITKNSTHIKYSSHLYKK